MNQTRGHKQMAYFCWITKWYIFRIWQSFIQEKSWIIIVWTQTMMMSDQYLYKSPALEVYGHCRLLLPWLRVPYWFFCNSGLKNCWHELPGIEPTTLDLISQSGDYDLAATANPWMSRRVVLVWGKCQTLPTDYQKTNTPQFDHILLNCAPSNPPNIKYWAIICPSQFQDPAVQKWEGLEKKHARVSGYSVPDAPKQKSAFQDTWYSRGA